MNDAAAMRAWSMDLMLERQPDFLIGPADAPYLRRWWVIPRNEMSNVYLHEILRSDDDRALHDHPWQNTSVLLVGSYVEHTPEGSFVREPGSIVHRQATDCHRLEVNRGARVVSLFITGPKVRDWGFHCPKGWVRWQDFVDDRDSGLVGRGCGEMS
jgi:hypothetical protein